MSRILIPIDFSANCAHALQYAHQVALDKGMKLSLLHCYSPYGYNRKYEFKDVDYEKGIQGMLIDFYKRHVGEEMKDPRFLARAGSLAEKVISVSTSYELVVISGHQLNSTSTKWLGSRSLTIISEAKCPVIIVPVSTSYQPWNNIWHIRRAANETAIIEPHLNKLRIVPSIVQVKTFQQTTFTSSFWKYIVLFSKKPSAQAEKLVEENIDSGKPDLMVLVSHQKSRFQQFVNSENYQVIFHFEIPLLVFQER